MDIDSLLSHDKKKIFSFGSNSLGQLSQNHTEDVHTPTEVRIPPHLQLVLDQITIVAGGNHTFLLNTSSTTGRTEVYSVGDDTYGQCARGDSSLVQTGASRRTENLHYPHNGNITMGPPPIPPVKNFTTTFELVPPPPPPLEGAASISWKSISCGWQYTILLASNGRLYSCGHGAKGELGLGPDVITANVPTLIPDFPPADTVIKQVTSGVEHTVVLLSNTHVYGWGNGRKGQLGDLGDEANYSWKPRRLYSHRPTGIGMEIAACGRDFSAFIGAAGDVYVTGDDKYGVIRTSPSIDTINWTQFLASWSTAFLLDNQGKVLSWGRNTHGQRPAIEIPPLRRLAVGSEHALGVSMEGEKLYAWGWGEHGNCGPIMGLKRGDVVTWANEVAIPGLEGVEFVIEGIAAGCATSWVWVKRIE